MLLDKPFQLLDQFFKEFQSFGQVYFCLRASAKDQGLTRAVSCSSSPFFHNFHIKIQHRRDSNRGPLANVSLGPKLPSHR